MTFRTITLFAVTAALAACAPGMNPQEPQYWQRISASETLYQQGPKAQQMLDRDIGRCVAELEELENLGAIKRPAVPADLTGRVLGPDETRQASWTKAKNNSSLIPTDSTFHDFNSCMKSKGWERIFQAGTNVTRMFHGPSLEPNPGNRNKRMSKNILISMGFVSLLALTACGITGPNIKGSYFWQQINMTDAIYKQGPEAQKSLDRDISRCVVELREAESLNVTKNAIPADNAGQTPDPDQQKMADWDTPDHNGALLAEHTDYHDFEGCMKAKGWEHVDKVPYEVAHEARANWYLANVKYGYDPRVGKPAKAASESFGHLNN